MQRAVLLLLALAALGFVALARPDADATPLATHSLAPVEAVGVRLDTLLLGGYASGRFVDAVRELASDLSDEERVMVGEHLDRIFADRLDEQGLGETGRLRVAYERAVRPDGSTRSIRVLGVEVASAGRLHTAYYFERDGRPGYYDPFGAPVDDAGWDGPLAELRVTSPFGLRRMHPILRQVLPHTGVDFGASRGEPVRATADGIVVSAGDRGGYGLMVELRHPNGYGTRYAHLQRIDGSVAPARLVRRGEVIGYVGMTGMATGPHLHYEVRRRGQPVDPQTLGNAATPASTLGSSQRWAHERRQLTELLARSPTMLDTSARDGA